MPKIRTNYYKHTNGYIIVNGQICVAGDDIEVDHTVDCYAENGFDYLSDVFSKKCSPDYQSFTPKEIKGTEQKLKCFKEDLTPFKKRKPEFEENREMENSCTSPSTLFTDTNKSDMSDSPHSCYFSGSETSETSISHRKNEEEFPEGNRKRKSSSHEKLMDVNGNLPPVRTNNDLQSVLSFLRNMDFGNSQELQQFENIRDLVASKEKELEKRKNKNKKEEKSPIPVNRIGAARQQLQKLLMIFKTLIKMKLIHELPYLTHMETLLDVSECYLNSCNFSERRLSNPPILPPYINNETTLKPLQKNTYNTYDVKIVVDDYFAKKATRC